MKKIVVMMGVLFIPVLLFAASTDVGNSGPAFPNPLRGVDDIFTFVKTLIENIIIPFGSVLVVLMIIWSGFLFVMARDNTTKIADAKNAFMYAVIGAVILLGSWVIAESIKGTVCLLYENPPASLNCGGSETNISTGSVNNTTQSFPTPMPSQDEDLLDENGPMVPTF